MLREATGLSDKEGAFVVMVNKTYRLDPEQVAVDLWSLERGLDAAAKAKDVETKTVALALVAAVPAPLVRTGHPGRQRPLPMPCQAGSILYGERLSA